MYCILCTCFGYVSFEITLQYNYKYLLWLYKQTSHQNLNYAVRNNVMTKNTISISNDKHSGLLSSLSTAASCSWNSYDNVGCGNRKFYDYDLSMTIHNANIKIEYA